VNKSGSPAKRPSFRRTTLYLVVLVQVLVFALVFMLSIFLTNRSMTQDLYSGVSQKASLVLANLRIATSLLIKDGKRADLRRLIENSGASRLVKRIRLISATDRRVIVSTDSTEEGMEVTSLLVESVLSRHSMLEMSGMAGLRAQFEAVVPVSGSLFDTGLHSDTVAVLQYIADMSAEKELERDVFLALVGQTALLLSIMVATMVLTWIFFVSRPLERFLAVTNQVAMGDFTVKILPKRQDEFAAFAVAFNQMIEEIGRKNEDLFKYSETLEARVTERTESLHRKTIELEETRQRGIDAERTALAGRIAGGIAHEINNPSSFVMSNLETLKEYVTAIIGIRAHLIAGKPIPEADLAELDWQIADSPKLIDESLNGMHRIIDIVRNLEISVYPDKGGCREADIADVLDRAVTDTCSAIEATGRLHRHWNPGLTSHCIPVLLETAFANILRNAVDQVGESGSIDVWAAVESDRVIIAIADTGVGILPETLSHIFEPFFTTKDPGKGIGLGLTIAKSIIEKAGGRIKVYGAPGQTRFTISLPASPA